MFKWNLLSILWEIGGRSINKDREVKVSSQNDTHGLVVLKWSQCEGGRPNKMFFMPNFVSA